MNLIYRVVTLFFLVGLVSVLQAQTQDERVIQYSGVVTFEDNGDLLPLIGATVTVKGTGRGTTTALDGFFSIVMLEGETLEIRYLGFQTEEIKTSKKTKTYDSILLTLKPDSYSLPEVRILPIPSREHFKIEFLAMEVNDPFGERARENLAQGLMQDILADLPADGIESGNIVMNQISQSYYYHGQLRPQNIGNVFAWKKFIEAWKNGDFKKKKKDDE